MGAFHVRAQPQGESSAPAQRSATEAAMDRTLVVLDPAHGGQDAGATLGDRVLEKDVTLALAAQLRAALTAAGFTVISTREAETVDPPTSDQRAEIANRAHAVACLVLHATASGSGVHLYTSTLPPTEEDASADGAAASGAAFVPVPWERAQAEYVSRSLRLASDLSAALGKANLPLVSGRAPVRPLDNLMCPAVAIELAPLPVADGETTPVTDAAYQQRVAATLAATLAAWRNQADLSAPQAAATDTHGGTEASGPAVQARAAEQAAAEARAAAEASGRAAARLAAGRAATDKAHAAVGVPAGGQGRTDDVDPNGAVKAGPASSSSGTGAPMPHAGGGE